MAAERVLAKNSLRAKDAAHDTAVMLPASEVLLRNRGAQAAEARSLRGDGQIEIEWQANSETLGQGKKIDFK